MGAVLWQSGWVYILPVWPCPGVRQMGPQCLLTPPVSDSSIYAAVVCVGGLESVCYIWSISPVLSGVLCEFKYALSNSLWPPLIAWFLSRFSLGFGLSREFFLATVLLHLYCLLFGFLGWLSVQHFDISADVRRPI